MKRSWIFGFIAGIAIIIVLGILVGTYFTFDFQNNLLNDDIETARSYDSAISITSSPLPITPWTWSQHLEDKKVEIANAQAEIIDTYIAKLDGLSEQTKRSQELYELGVIHQLKPDLPPEKPNLAYNGVDDIVKNYTTYEKNLSNHIIRTQKSIELTKYWQNIQNPIWDKTDSELWEMIHAMSSEEKAGQFLIISISGTELSPQTATFLSEENIGGVILMGYNIQSPTQTQELTRAVKASNSTIPLIVSIDQEGGLVQRLPWDDTPSPTKWSELDQEEMCYVGTKKAKLLQEYGITLNLSPVADLTSSNPAFINNRTVSENPNTVTRYLQSYIECHQTAGVSTTLKHFPGHGATPEDSHFTLPTISLTQTEWLDSHAVPFRQNLQSDFIMLGHLTYTALDSQPATQSSKVTEILTQDWGYEGLLITDDMHQLEVSTEIDTKTAIKNALNAGIHQILFVNYSSSPEQLHQETSELITSGQVSPETVDSLLFDILQYKRTMKS